MLQRFMGLFSGLDRAYGTYTLDGSTSDRGKAKGKAVTRQSPVTEHLWEAHLAGEQGLGIVPIRDDNTVLFGVIDVDVYDLDLPQLEATVNDAGLPLILLRSKSGGAHLYLFLHRPTQAAVVREILTAWSLAIGYPGVEIFPKQDALAGPGDVGNWINMPYFDAQRTTRYAIRGGAALTAEEFLDYAESTRVDPEALESIVPAEDEQHSGAPPCLATLFVTGFPEGSMNNALFDCGVYARKRWPDCWESKVIEYNDRYFRGTLREVKQIVRALNRKDYFYMCDQPPISTFCDKARCAKAEFGIGGGGEDNGMEIEGLTKICTDPPIWVVQIGGRRVQMSTDDLLTQPRFSKRCVEELTVLPFQLKADKWQKFIRTMLLEAHIVEAPTDAGARGQFMYHLEQFCVTRAPANTRDEILLGKPWHSEGKTYFRSSDLIRYLEQQRFRDLKQHEIYATLHAMMDVDKKFFNLKGRGTNVWVIPSFDVQVEDFDIPRVQEEEF